MKVIYKGKINQLFIIEEVTSGKLRQETVILEKDALFYRNVFGRKISFDYQSYLPDLE